MRVPVFNHVSQVLAATVVSVFFVAGLSAADGLWTNPQDETLPYDFQIQGEYVSAEGNDEKLGCQVISLGDGSFQAVIYPGGLPGAGWDGKNKILMDGKLNGKRAEFKAAEGKKRYLGKSPEEFSATSEFPPKGQQAFHAGIESGFVKGRAENGSIFELKKTNRTSSTIGKEAPQGAIVLFDGSNTDQWKGGRLDEKSKLLNTDGKDILTKKKFNNYTMHLEFMLPYKPAARGQGRGNSGFYQVDHYEVQVLDSFGLEGKNNECGGIYSIKESDVNMCLPPLTWQTYDVDFTNAVADEGGKKIKNARITIRLNGVVIHDDVELPGKTGGSRGDPEGTPGPIKLQGHGNPLQYRNVWIVEKE